MNKKIAIYCRVSTSEQTTENQRIRLTEYANRMDYRYDVFEETMSTRKTRPVKQKLLAMLRNGQYESVLVYKLDRWARSSTELILDTKELIDKGIGFISLSDNLDFTTATGKLHFQIIAAFAEFERSLISDRTKEGLNRARKEGKQLGRRSGSKDKVKRRKSGYILRHARNRQVNNGLQNGIYQPIENFIN